MLAQRTQQLCRYRRVNSPVRARGLECRLGKTLALFLAVCIFGAAEARAQAALGADGLPAVAGSSDSQSGRSLGGVSDYTPNLASVSPVFSIAGDEASDEGRGEVTPTRRSSEAPARDDEREAPSIKVVAEPSQFETFVEATVGRRLPRFGSSLVIDGAKVFAPSTTANVPPAYIMNPGDTVFVGLTGSVEGNLELTIGNDGRVFIPRIGAVRLAGVPFGEVADLIGRRLGEQFRDFHVAVTAGKLHGIRVYVTGYAALPGSYTMGSLSTVVNAVLAAGGPSGNGSFRSITVRRNGQIVTQLDLYDLLMSGDKSRDVVLQNEDVIYIGPAGAEMAIVGAVNAEAIYETLPGETLDDLLRYAGGLNSVAEADRLMIARFSNLDLMGWQEISMADAVRAPVERGSIVRVLSAVDYARPRGRQAIIATIEGEVQRPGRYYLEPGATIGDLLARAGNLTPEAYVFGTKLDRTSVRLQQREGFDRAIKDLELSLASLPLTDQRDAGTLTTRVQGAQAVLRELRSREPDGRLVLSLQADDVALPADIRLENDDRIYIPPRPITIGVFGAVYQPGSFIFRSGSTFKDYIDLAGGPQKIADRSDIFVVRANGAVVAVRQGGHFSNAILRGEAAPGDVVFVPARSDRGALFDRLKDVATILYQMSLGAAALKVLGD